MSNDIRVTGQRGAPPRSSTARWVPIVIIGILVVGGLYIRSRRANQAGGPPAGGQGKGAPDIASVKVVPASLNTITETLPITGTLNSNQNIQLNSKISGRVAAVYVEDGARVKKGQLLVQLDDADLRARLAQMQQDYLDLSSGRKVVSAAYTQGDGSKSVTFTKATLGQMAMMIRQMQAQLGIINTPRRPLRPVF